MIVSYALFLCAHYSVPYTIRLVLDIQAFLNSRKRMKNY